jgi:hypothetical protein
MIRTNVSIVVEITRTPMKGKCPYCDRELELSVIDTKVKIDVFDTRRCRSELHDAGKDPEIVYDMQETSDLAEGYLDNLGIPKTYRSGCMILSSEYEMKRGSTKWYLETIKAKKSGDKLQLLLNTKSLKFIERGIEMRSDIWS